ncbi:MAG TPA: transglutaminaseTgpA domain-containing protein, partial [Egibacteraceae bacterium]|nr:transglutaminaseTgpA domain-containing protein [Egibacteraceae bacterium]
SGAAPWSHALAAMALLPLGAWVSYRQRGKRNLGIKAMLALAALIALARFFSDLGFAGSLDDARQPLAELFLAVQIIHGFDLPARRDLGFTIASSLTLVALAAATTSTMGLIPVLAIWAALTAASLAAMQRSAAYERAEQLCDAAPIAIIAPDGPARPSALHLGGDVPAIARAAAPALKSSAAVLAAGALTFLLLPQQQSTRTFSLPMRGLAATALSDVEVTNPGLPNSGRSGGAFNPDAYFGFAERLDARTVGELSDEIVLRVRADRPRPWRGMVFDRYDGAVWTRSSADIADSQVRTGIPALLELEPRPLAASGEVVQTFELVEDTPNLIFAAAEAVVVYSATGSVRQWSDGTITTASLQEAGTIYSVISRVDDSPPARLARQGPWTSGGQLPAAELQRYLQLPGDLPQRVRDLSAEIATDQPSPYLIATAVESWLGENTEYVLNVPPAPLGRDIVDHFLFSSRRGWCEPIASSMVVLLRASGVPARLATGFTPGDRNPLTGWHTVRMNDAHAWVEAWIPGHGWVAFDPTGAVPLGEEPPGLRIPLVDLARSIGRAVADAIPDGVGHALAATAAWAREHPLIAVPTAVAGAAAALLLTRLRRRPATPAGPFERLAAGLAANGVALRPWETPREYVALARLRRRDLPRDALAIVLAWEESRRYGDGAQAPTLQEADAAADAALEALARPPKDAGFALAGSTREASEPQ